MLKNMVRYFSLIRMRIKCAIRQFNRIYHTCSQDNVYATKISLLRFILNRKMLNLCGLQAFSFHRQISTISAIVHKNQDTRHLISPTDLVNHIFERIFAKRISKNNLTFESREEKTSCDISEYHDPYLLTGEEAMLAVKYLYDQGELFYDDIPHERALLKNQEERRRNGLHDHILRSLRLTSSFFRKS